jgi:hypothetical protein
VLLFSVVDLVIDETLGRLERAITKMERNIDLAHLPRVGKDFIKGRRTAHSINGSLTPLHSINYRYPCCGEENKPREVLLACRTGS